MAGEFPSGSGRTSDGPDISLDVNWEEIEEEKEEFLEQLEEGNLVNEMRLLEDLEEKLDEREESIDRKLATKNRELDNLVRSLNEDLENVREEDSGEIRNIQEAWSELESEIDQIDVSGRFAQIEAPSAAGQDNRDADEIEREKEEWVRELDEDLAEKIEVIRKLTTSLIPSAEGSDQNDLRANINRIQEIISSEAGSEGTLDLHNRAIAIEQLLGVVMSAEDMHEELFSSDKGERVNNLLSNDENRFVNRHMKEEKKTLKPKFKERIQDIRNQESRLVELLDRLASIVQECYEIDEEELEEIKDEIQGSSVIMGIGGQEGLMSRIQSIREEIAGKTSMDNPLSKTVGEVESLEETLEAVEQREEGYVDKDLRVANELKEYVQKHRELKNTNKRRDFDHITPLRDVDDIPVANEGAPPPGFNEFVENLSEILNEVENHENGRSNTILSEAERFLNDYKRIFNLERADEEGAQEIMSLTERVEGDIHDLRGFYENSLRTKYDDIYEASLPEKGKISDELDVFLQGGSGHVGLEQVANDVEELKEKIMRLGNNYGFGDEDGSSDEEKSYEEIENLLKATKSEVSKMKQDMEEFIVFLEAYQSGDRSEYKKLPDEADASSEEIERFVGKTVLDRAMRKAAEELNRDQSELTNLLPEIYNYVEELTGKLDEIRNFVYENHGLGKEEKKELVGDIEGLKDAKEELEQLMKEELESEKMAGDNPPEGTLPHEVEGRLGDIRDDLVRIVKKLKEELEALNRTAHLDDDIENKLETLEGMLDEMGGEIEEVEEESDSGFPV